MKEEKSSIPFCAMQLPILHLKVQEHLKELEILCCAAFWLFYYHPLTEAFTLAGFLVVLVVVLRVIFLTGSDGVEPLSLLLSAGVSSFKVLVIVKPSVAFPVTCDV